MLVTSQVWSILLCMLEMLEIEIYPLLDNGEPLQTIFSHQSINYHLISWNVRLFWGIWAQSSTNCSYFWKICQINYHWNLLPYQMLLTMHRWFASNLTMNLLTWREARRVHLMCILSMFLDTVLQGPLVMDMISEEAMVQVDQPLPSACSCRNGYRQPQSHHRWSFRQLVMISNIF